MDPDLKVRIELEALVAERDGMIAENAQRSRCDHAMAYGDLAFDAIAARMRELVAPDHAPITVSPCNCEQALMLQEQLDGSRALLAATKSALEDALKARSDWESAAASACRERDAEAARASNSEAGMMETEKERDAEAARAANFESGMIDAQRDRAAALGRVTWMTGCCAALQKKLDEAREKLDAANKRLHTTQADHWLVDEIPQ